MHRVSDILNCVDCKLPATLAEANGVASYLNFKGCDEEGLYRVPGSGKDIRAWQQRFDKGTVLKTSKSYDSAHSG